MLSLHLDTPETLLQQIADRAQARRLALNLTQAGLAARSGVSVQTSHRLHQQFQRLLLLP